MSNQVYDNAQQKYYAQRGLSSYVMSGNLVVPPASSVTVVPFNTVMLNQTDAGNITAGSGPSAGIFTAHVEGMYSFEFRINPEPSPGAALNYVQAMFLSGGFGGAVAQNLGLQNFSYPAALGSNPTSSTFATIFVPAGATFYFSVQNLNGTSGITVLAGATVLYATKVA